MFPKASSRSRRKHLRLGLGLRSHALGLGAALEALKASSLGVFLGGSEAPPWRISDGLERAAYAHCHESLVLRRCPGGPGEDRWPVTSSELPATT